jgi:hypothetical protein
MDKEPKYSIISDLATGAWIILVVGFIWALVTSWPVSP